LRSREVEEVVVPVRAPSVAGQGEPRGRVGRRPALAAKDGAPHSVLKGVDDLAQRVSQDDRIRTVLPVHVGDEVPDDEKLADGSRRGDDEDSVERNRSSGEVDRPVGDPRRPVDSRQGPPGERLPRFAEELGEDVRGVRPRRVVKDLLNDHRRAGRGCRREAENQ
jgi:hypothetical protein